MYAITSTTMIIVKMTTVSIQLDWWEKKLGGGGGELLKQLILRFSAGRVQL